jgi:hypothetical protein
LLRSQPVEKMVVVAAADASSARRQLGFFKRFIVPKRTQTADRHPKHQQNNLFY